MAVTAGYSGTPLVRKLGLKPGHRIAVINAPPDFRTTLGSLPPKAQLSDRLGTDLDAIVAFVEWEKDLRAGFPKLIKSVKPDGMIWVAWPKKSARRPGDMTEDRVRAVALPIGFVDIKVCAIDEVWSGLKLVLRLEKR